MRDKVFAEAQRDLILEKNGDDALDGLNPDGASRNASISLFFNNPSKEHEDANRLSNSD